MRLEEEISKYIKDDQGKILVDWKAITKINHRKGYSEEIYKGILDRLINMGILSFEPKGNFGLYADRLSLNPDLRLLELFFARLEDAKEYKKTEHKDAQYYISIRKIEVIE